MKELTRNEIEKIYNDFLIKMGKQLAKEYGLTSKDLRDDYLDNGDKNTNEAYLLYGYDSIKDFQDFELGVIDGMYRIAPFLKDLY